MRFVKVGSRAWPPLTMHSANVSERVLPLQMTPSAQIHPKARQITSIDMQIRFDWVTFLFLKNRLLYSVNVKVLSTNDRIQKNKPAAGVKYRKNVSSFKTFFHVVPSQEVYKKKVNLKSKFELFS